MSNHATLQEHLETMGFKLFLEHPASVGQSWSAHALSSLRLAGLFSIGALQALVHALIPAVFPTSSSDLVSFLNKELGAFGRNRDKNE